MNVINTNIDGVLIIEPKIFGETRGYFFESFSQREFNEKVAPILGHTVNFVVESMKGTEDISKEQLIFMLLFLEKRYEVSKKKIHKWK